MASAPPKQKAQKVIEKQVISLVSLEGVMWVSFCFLNVWCSALVACFRKEQIRSEEKAKEQWKRKWGHLKDFDKASIIIIDSIVAFLRISLKMTKL